MSFPSADSGQGSFFAAWWAHAQDAMLAVDCVRGTVVEANSAAADLIGCPRLEELTGRELHALFSPQDHACLQDVLRKGVCDTPSLEDFHLLCKDGRTLTVLLSTLATKGLDDTPMLLCVLRQINQLERQRHRLATQQWALSAYAGAALALARADSSHGLLHDICEAITKESIYVLAWVGLAEESEGKPVRVLAAAGSALGYLEGLTVTWDENISTGQGPTGRAIRSGKREIMEDRDTASNYEHWRERAARFDIYSSITIPLVVEGLWRGALMVYAGCVNAFEQVAIDVFEDMAREIGHGLQALHRKELLESEKVERAYAQERLTEAFSAIVTALVAAVEARDPYTAGHEARVAEIACAIGREMGWEEDRLTALRMASMVHDIGKISIPSRILVKPGRLSDEEFELIKTHPDTGYAILKDIPFDWPIAEIMRQHHEKLDGSGYPLGLKGDEILPESRVLAVADIVEAMASDRPYRSGIPLDVVLNEIERQAGLLLDADAVRACLRLFQMRGFVLPGVVRLTF